MTCDPRWRCVSGSLSQQLSLTFELFPLFPFLLLFLTILFWLLFWALSWAVWRPDSRSSFWSQYFFFQLFPPCLGSLYTDQLFTVGVSCWPSVVPRCSCMSGLMSPASWEGGGDTGAVLRSRRTRYRPVLPSVITGNVRSLPNKIADPASAGLPWVQHHGAHWDVANGANPGHGH